MKPSLLKYSTWISLLLLAAVSCKAPVVALSGRNAVQAYTSLADGSFDRIDFKARISYKEKELPGRMIIKNDGSGLYRIAFFNELGMTYLEAAYHTDHPKKNLTIRQVSPMLDHPKTLKSLEKSFQRLFTRENKNNTKTTASTIDKYDITIKLNNGFTLHLQL
ncbi:MAG: hypothetical protein K0B08_07780 [Bacteroidales bacterium]|nr:hypothetical protein [Bacteroidales bacterium]